MDQVITLGLEGIIGKKADSPSTGQAGDRTG